VPSAIFGQGDDPLGYYLHRPSALGAMAAELGDVVRSIDINPFMVLPAGDGGRALDALIVLKSTRPRG
jgi:hypothetical protein